MKKKHIAAIALLACTFAFAAQPSQKPADHGEHRTSFTPENIPWAAGPPSLPPGAQFAVLEGNPAQPGLFTMRLRVPDGYRIPPHWHPGWERVTVISGTFARGMGDKFDETKLESFGAGSYTYMPPKMPHFAGMRGETIIQIHSEGPWSIEYVNASDDPRKSTKK